MNFKNLHLINPIIRAATETGYSKPTEIQEKSIPQILMGKDVIGCAPAGTGKTAAFVMSVIQLLKKSAPEHKEIRTLILAPTQKSVLQIEEDFTIYSKYLPLSQLSIHEGDLQGSQLAALIKRVDVLIATPARLLDLTQQRAINLSKIEMLVMDEMDGMVDIESRNNVKKIVTLIPRKRQTLLFSSTWSEKTKKLAEVLVNNPIEVKINISEDTASSIEKKEKRPALEMLMPSSVV